MSNILRVWTPEAQERLLAQAPGWPKGITLYRDDVKPRARKARSTEALIERANMLRPTGRRSRDETIYVAALGLLAWTAPDLLQCLAAASDRGATIVALNTGRRIEPGAKARQIADAQEDFARDKRRGAAVGRPGYQVAADAKKADTLRRVELIRQDWGDPAFATDELLLRAGTPIPGTNDMRPMAYVTARGHLGVRRHVFKQRAGLAKARAAQEIPA